MKTIHITVIAITSFFIMTTVVAMDISEAELIKAFSGKTVEGYHHKKDFAFKQYYDQSGALYGESEKKGKRQGKWSVRDGQFCEQWVGRKLKCRDVEKHGTKIRKYSNSDRHILTYKKFIAGNAFVKKLASIITEPQKPEIVVQDTKPNESKPQDVITEFFSGKTLEGYHSKKDFEFKRFFSPDGKVIEKSNRFGQRTGSWARKENRMCIQWDGRKNKCRIVERSGDVVYQYNRKDNQKVIRYKLISLGNTL